VFFAVLGFDFFEQLFKIWRLAAEEVLGKFVFVIATAAETNRNGRAGVLREDACAHSQQRFKFETVPKISFNSGGRPLSTTRDTLPHSCSSPKGGSGMV
jgi:hypothetical protein